ncbi:hypothetical protein FACS1894152_4140 [Bacilli bacterium]|nr:hypothetical protein FACS1894152_4140 [Bacilli bacterium]
MTNVMEENKVSGDVIERKRGIAIFDNSRGHKSSSIVLEYIFFSMAMVIITYSVMTGKDVPANTATLLKWMGLAVTCGVEGYKINERICDIKDRKV